MSIKFGESPLRTPWQFLKFSGNTNCEHKCMMQSDKVRSNGQASHSYILPDRELQSALSVK